MTAQTDAPPPPRRDLVVVGASAGGVETLQRLVAVLPAGLPACLVVVLHVPSSGPSAMPRILSRAGALPAVHASPGDVLECGVIYLAPPDRHVLVVRHRLRLSAGAKENGHRPAIDPLFRSAAALGARVTGVILSGMLDDGAAGLRRIKAAGGLAVVQDPDQAMYPAMPRNAMAAVDVDHVLSVEAIGELIVATAGDADATRQRSDDPPPTTDIEIEMIELSPAALHGEPADPGEPTAFTCPDCSGVLNAIEDGPLRRYRCRTGHAWSPEALAAAQSTVVENALWVALRSLEEKVSLATKLSEGARRRGLLLTETRFAAQAAESRANAEILRKLLATWGSHMQEAAAET